LKSFPFLYIAAQTMDSEGSRMTDLINEKGISKIKMPAFVRGNAMKSRKIAFPQQKINTGSYIPVALEKDRQGPVADGERGAINFPESSSFNVLGQAQFFYPIGCVGSHIK